MELVSWLLAGCAGNLIPAYYGGEACCDQDIGIQGDYDLTELVCGACSDVSRAQMCPKHGTDFLEYKCRYCCSVAVFFCFGRTHFCNACNDDFQRITSIPKPDLPHCPAGKSVLGLDRKG
ncbi:E3 ubiquitin-protein ligase MYCBP2-like isoform X2 [Asterias rubens]|uniref:E3 ubiquitin-protein ligase MYCBP2-like isoform X2 n=1 Tax=Asterias rubens TaxID=7604 RepID=UPI0014554509|nr:E3 ubiquitin-protein ligase MYCBP2-like isoform X2 [Asterias rubens]